MRRPLLYQSIRRRQVVAANASVDRPVGVTQHEFDAHDFTAFPWPGKLAGEQALKDTGNPALVNVSYTGEKGIALVNNGENIKIPSTIWENLSDRTRDFTVNMVFTRRPDWEESGGVGAAWSYGNSAYNDGKTFGLSKGIYRWWDDGPKLQRGTIYGTHILGVRNEASTGRVTIMDNGVITSQYIGSPTSALGNAAIYLGAASGVGFFTLGGPINHFEVAKDVALSDDNWRLEQKYLRKTHWKRGKLFVYLGNSNFASALGQTDIAYLMYVYLSDAALQNGPSNHMMVSVSGQNWNAIRSGDATLNTPGSIAVSVGLAETLTRALYLGMEVEAIIYDHENQMSQAGVAGSAATNYSEMIATAAFIKAINPNIKVTAVSHKPSGPNKLGVDYVTKFNDTKTLIDGDFTIAGATPHVYSSSSITVIDSMVKLYELTMYDDATKYADTAYFVAGDSSQTHWNDNGKNAAITGALGPHVNYRANN